MKSADVKVGGRYAARVGNGITSVTIIGRYRPSAFGSHERLTAINERTGREVRMTAARLRYELPGSDLATRLRWIEEKKGYKD